MKKIFLILFFFLNLSFYSNCFTVTPENSRAQYRPYPSDSIQQQLSTPPEGYIPFHIEHYGRHGSRWLIDKNNYSVPVEQLSKAERNGCLTPFGENILFQLRDLNTASEGRLGELTPLGATQHREIAERMVLNFPEIFAKNSVIDARSTIVIRCILSMLNETDAISAAVPGLKIRTDASEHDMWYMNHHDPVRNVLADQAREIYFKPFAENHAPTYKFINRLVDNEKFINDSIDKNALFTNLLEVALNMGSHPERHDFLTEIFSPEEINDAWLCSNASWFLSAGNSSLTENRSAMVQRHLLKNMIESADTTLLSPVKSANLRFGHETMVLSLAALMNLNDYGKEVNTLDQLADCWRAYEVYPMACNLQIVFYRPEVNPSEDNILVKVLLNEREVEISNLDAVEGPYYSWKQFREILLQNLTEPTPEQWQLAEEKGYV